MSDLITYDDKIRLKSQNVSEKYKVTAGDMNEIKSVVNTNVELVDEINKPENWVSVGEEEPTDGRRVWFAKSKNLFDIDNAYHGTINASGFIGPNEEFRTTQNISTQPGKTYYFSTTQKSGTTGNQIYIAYYNSSGTFVSRTSYNTLKSAFTTPANCYYMRAGVRSQNQENIMLNEGTIELPYEPYINPSINVDNEQWFNKTNLVSVGVTSPIGGERVWFGKSKNLLPTNKYITTRTTNGVTFTNNGDGTFNVSGTASANTTMAILPENNFQLEQGQAYYLYSSVPYNATTFNLSISMTENGTGKYCLANNTYTPTAQPIQERVTFYVPNGTSVNATNVKLMLVKGNTAPSQYEPYVDEGIYVDNELFYSKSLIKSINFGSITTSASGYYDLGLMCNEVAIIGIKHNAIASDTKIETYSNQLGHLFIRCSVNGEYSARTINNLVVYCI